MNEQRIIVTGLTNKNTGLVDISFLMMREKETLELRHNILTTLHRSSKVRWSYWTSRNVTNLRAFKPFDRFYRDVSLMKKKRAKDLDTSKHIRKCGMTDLVAIKTSLYTMNTVMPALLHPL